MRLDRTRIILTGAASGIGAALLSRLSAYPCAILAADCDAPRLADTVARLPPRPATVTTLTGDIGRREDVDALFAAAAEYLGGVDLFIANAGFAYYERIDRPDWAHIEALLRVNVVSPIYAAEKMAALNAGRGRGEYRTVIVGSAMGRLAIPGYALYGASKAALDRFAEAYWLELPDPSTLALVYPIGTRTRFFEQRGQSAPHPWPTQSPEQVASAIIRGIEQDARAIYPSFLFRLTLAVDRVLPFTRRIEQYIEGRRFRKWLREGDRASGRESARARN
jgi:short-subunit dehydrogenase